MGFWDGSGISWTVCKQSAPDFLSVQALKTVCIRYFWWLFTAVVYTPPAATLSATTSIMFSTCLSFCAYGRGLYTLLLSFCVDSLTTIALIVCLLSCMWCGHVAICVCLSVCLSHRLNDDHCIDCWSPVGSCGPVCHCVHPCRLVVP